MIVKMLLHWLLNSKDTTEIILDNWKEESNEDLLDNCIRKKLHYCISLIRNYN